MLPGQVTFNKPISGENAKSNKLKYVIFGDFLIMKIASMKLVGTPCMTFLSILTQVSFKGQFWLSFDDTDFLCPHPNISFEAKNHPKNLPNFFVPFCQAEPVFCRRYQEEIFFLLAVNWISPFLCSCNINEAELSSSYSVIWHTLILLFLDWKKLFHPDDAFIAILPF